MIKILEDNGKQLVDARELHAFLEVGKDFSTWIKDRIEKYGFVEGADFVVLEGSPILGNINPGRPQKDYAISLDMAKEIAMLERSDKGKEARRYFIECEKKLKELRQPMDELEMMAAMIKQQLEQRANMRAIEASVDRIDDEIKVLREAMRIDDEFLTISGFLALTKSKPRSTEEIKNLGIAASKYCKEHGIAISQVPSAKWGKVNAYPKSVLEELI